MGQISPLKIFQYKLTKLVDKEIYMLYNGYRKEGQDNKANDKRDTLIYSKKKVNYRL